MIKLFTHNDLDGVACAIIYKIVYGDNVDIEYHTPNTINDRVMDYLQHAEYDRYKITHITDLSVNKQLAETIDSLHHEHKFLLHDHHKTTLWLNAYSWANVKPVSDDGIKECGASLLYKYFTGLELYHIQHFVESVRRYDTWDWVALNDEIAPKLAKLLYIYGEDRFVQQYVNKLAMNEKFLNNLELTLLDIEEDRTKRYIEQKRPTMRRIIINGHTAGLVFAEQYISELGHTLLNENPDLDFIVIIKSDKEISFRSRSNFDVSVLAKSLNGGGHPQSAGCPIPNDVLNNFLEVLFMQREIMEFEYKNWKGKTETRTVFPKYIWCGLTEYHTDFQWFLRAYDVNKQDDRDFAIKDILKFL